MDSNSSLSDKIRGWFEHSPKAQRAYERLSADLDAVVEWVDSATRGLREKVAPIIDPPRPEPVAQPEPDTLTAEETAAPPADEAASESGQGAPERSQDVSHPSS